MSTVEQHPPRVLPPLVHGQRLDRATFHERYEAMPENTRAELIGGVVYMPSQLYNDHGDTTMSAAGWLAFYKLRTPGLIPTAGTSTLLDDAGEPQPDLSVRIEPACGGQTHIEGGYIAGAPELVVELARSSKSIDLGSKKNDYERTGVLEYVVIAIDPDEIFWFVRRNERFVRLDPGPDGLYRSEAMPGLWLDAAALYDGNLNRLAEVVEQGCATHEHAAFVARLNAARNGA
jgi:Uma2 family endonuclease